MEIQSTEPQSEEQPNDVWESTINCLLNNRKLFLDDSIEDDSIILNYVISHSDVVDSGDAIPQHVMKNNPAEEYLKAIDYMYRFEAEENLQLLSSTKIVDVCSETNDDTSNGNIQDEKDSYINAPAHTKDFEVANDATSHKKILILQVFNP